MTYCDYPYYDGYGHRHYYRHSPIPPAQIVAPSESPVAAADAKAMSFALADLSDDLVNNLIAGATAQLDGPDGILKRCIVTQTWSQPFEDHWGTHYRLPALGNVTVTQVLIGSGAVDAADYEIKRDALGTYVKGPSGVTEIEFTCGFGDAAAVPQNIKSAIILLAADAYARVSENGNLKSFAVFDAFTEQYNAPNVNSEATMATVDALIARYRGFGYA